MGSVGYSGRALDILVGLDARGRIAGHGSSPRRSRSSPPPGPGPSSRASSRLPRPAGNGCHRGAARRRRRRRGGGQRGHHLLARHPRRDSPRAPWPRQGPSRPAGQHRPGELRAGRLGLAGGRRLDRLATGEPRRRDGPPGTPRIAAGCRGRPCRPVHRAVSGPRLAGPDRSQPHRAWPFARLSAGLPADDHLLFIAARGRYSSFEHRLDPLVVSSAWPWHRPTAPSVSKARTMSGSTSWRWRVRPSREAALLSSARARFPAGRTVPAAAPDPRPRRRRPARARAARDRLPPPGALPGAGTARAAAGTGLAGDLARPRPRPRWSLARHSPRSRACSSSRTVWRGGGGSGRGCGSPSSCSPFCGSAGTLRPSSRSSTC